MPIQQSGEDYLETIYLLHQKTGYVRSIDIANELGYAKPSISRAMSILKSDGYIIINDDGQIKLTKSGEEKALDVYGRHKVIRRFLEEVLGVNKITAESDACRIEHVISEESYLRLMEFTNSYKKYDE